jgi:hypothetical protein
MDIERPNYQKRVEISTQQRKPVVFEALLSNPEPEQMHFEVVFQGDGLQGETNFYIPPESTKTYELLYLPLKASN